MRRATSPSVRTSRTAARPADVAALDWDGYQALRFRPEHGLWADAGLRFQVRLFHLRLFFKRPVRMFDVVGDEARQLAYDPAMFDYGNELLHSLILRTSLIVALYGGPRTLKNAIIHQREVVDELEAGRPVNAGESMELCLYAIEKDLDLFGKRDSKVDLARIISSIAA